MVIAASGPSLTAEQIEAVRGYPLIAINTTFRLAPHANMVYGADWAWWRVHQAEVEKTQALRVTQSVDAFGGKPPAGLLVLQSVGKRGFSVEPDVIHQGGNSGYQAANIAFLAGASRILLIGFDMKAGLKKHWHGDHPPECNKSSNYGSFIQSFRTIEEDVEIINCTPGSALDAFPKRDLSECLS